MFEPDELAAIAEELRLCGVDAQHEVVYGAHMFLEGLDIGEDFFGALHDRPSSLVWKNCPTSKGTAMAAIDPVTAGAVLLATAATDAVYVMFTSAVVARKRVPAATWSSVWYLLSSYAVISYTENWVYVAFAAVGSWIGAYASITFLHRPPGGPPVGAAPE